MTDQRPYQVGDVVRLKGWWDDEKAVIYEIYRGFNGEGPGVSLITESGRDLGGFSETEQKDFLTFIRHAPINYQFTNVMQLSRDFENGVFAAAFS